MQRPKSGVAPELEPIVRNEDNRFCVDCGAKGPRWASVNLGNLGVHISTVKSLTLDTWQPKWVETVSRIGNRIANEYYESRLPANHRRPVHADGVGLVENYIRSKYQRKDFSPKDRPAPHELLAQGKIPQSGNRPMEPILIEETVGSSKGPLFSPKKLASSGVGASADLLGAFSPPSKPQPVVNSLLLQPVQAAFQPAPSFHAQPLFTQSPASSWPTQSTSFLAPMHAAPAPVAVDQRSSRGGLSGLADLDPFAVFAEKMK